MHIYTNNDDNRMGLVKQFFGVLIKRHTTQYAQIGRQISQDADSDPIDLFQD